jgi:flagellar FliL protein
MSESTAAPAPAPKKRGKLPILIALAVLVAAGGGGVFWWLSPRDAAAEEKAGPVAVVALEPFLVNLADPQASRFLRASISLVLDGEHGEALAHEGKESIALTKVRSAVLELLAEQTSAALVTPAGKTALKAAIAERAGHVLAHIKVQDVLFTDFVVQF